MKTTFVRQTTDDSLILQGLLYQPETATKNIILHIHGMSGNFYENRFLDTMAKTFTDKNWAFLAANNRGHDFIAEIPIDGKKEEYKKIGQVFEIFEESVLDIKVWIDYAQAQGYTNIILQGHSLGCSKVAFYYHNTRDNRIKKLVLASPSDMVSYAERGDENGEMRALAKKLIAQGKGTQILPKLYDNWSYISAQTMDNFSTKGNPIDVFNAKYPNSPSSTLESLDIPTLAFLGSGKDSYFTKTPQETLDILKNKAKNAKRFDTAVIKDAPHSYFGHEQEVADLIVDWINK